VNVNSPGSAISRGSANSLEGVNNRGGANSRGGANDRHGSRLWTLLACGCCALISSVAPAQVQRSGGGAGAANAQLMMQYQQADSERTQLKSDNAKLKKDLDDLKKQLDAATKQAAASKAGVSRDSAQLAAAQAANDRSAKDLADSKAKMQELVGKFRETITQMRGIESERSQLQQQLAQSKTAFDQCAERNYSLYQVDNEVLDRYAHEGAFSHMASAEPFTRIKRTEIDNLVLEYKERAEELRMKKVGPPGAASGGTTATPATTGATQAASPKSN
jgi:cell division septum initiation protein DivIVA